VCAFVALAWALLLAGCSTTSNLPEGETLYTGIKKLAVENRDKTEAGDVALEEVSAALDYAPNNAFLGSSYYRTPFPYKLWIYNRYREAKSGLGKWLFDHFSTTPVLMTTVNPSLRARVATNVLHNYGYFRGDVSYSIDYSDDHKQGKVNYLVNMRTPYIIDSVAYIKFPAVNDSLIRAHRKEQLLVPGDNFSVVNLEAERSRLSTLFRNNGFYYYQSDYITYMADTLQRAGDVSLRVLPRTDLSPKVNRQWKIGHIEVNMRKTQGRRQLNDSVQIRNVLIRYEGDKIPLRPRVLFNNFRFRSGQLYSAATQGYTQQNISRMGIFSSLEFSYAPCDTTATCDTLDVTINAMFDKPLNGELEFDLTSKSNDQVGPGVSFGISKLNAFRGGETFSLKLDASYEWQTGSSAQGGGSLINSYEFGATASLDYPRIVFPFWNFKWTRFPVSSSFKLNIDQLNRAGYFRMLTFGGSASYSYQRRVKSQISFSPLRLSFNLLQSTTAKFDSIIDNNTALYAGLRNQFIPAQTFTYTYDDSPLNPKHPIWWEVSATSAGNITSLIYRACGKPFNEKDKELFGNPFAQFVKLTGELRKTFNFSEKTQIATRIFAGVIKSYGNSTTAPYSEQFYIGGANSIRAYTVRTIGPGSYHSGKDSKYSYIDQTGDLKLEANVEYRFPLIAGLYGATFLDAGNIWLMKEDPARPGGKFEFKNLGRETAVGTGLGLRYDLDFLILRLDWGIALHAPYDTGKGGYFNIPRYKDAMGLHFAVGYPF
jgi:outer membrane protein assembly factor BamA